MIGADMKLRSIVLIVALENFGSFEIEFAAALANASASLPAGDADFLERRDGQICHLFRRCGRQGILPVTGCPLYVVV